MRVRALAALAALMLTVPGAAGAKIKFNPDFHFPAGKTVRIVVFRPDVQVGTLALGGVETVNADDTGTARQKLARELEQQQRANGNEVTFLGDQTGEAQQVVADYQALFRVVAGAVVEHKMTPGSGLPTKKDRFDWTLGPGAARLAEIGGGDYGVFLSTHDAYSTAGRKVISVLLGGLSGLNSGIHRSYAALVDLHTGDLVWFNVDPGSGGDPRTDEGATKRIGQLFNGFPSAPGAPPPATTAAAR